MTPLEKWRKAEGRRNRPERSAEPAAEVPLGTVLSRSITREATPFSQRRCYDGCFHPDDWEEVWTAWKEIDTNAPEDRLKFWRGLGRGSETVTQYKWEPNK